jgi:hypothetical protein
MRQLTPGDDDGRVFYGRALLLAVILNVLGGCRARGLEGMP